MLAPVVRLRWQALLPNGPAKPLALKRWMACSSAVVRRMLSSLEAAGSSNGLSVTCDRDRGLACAQGKHGGLTIACMHLRHGLEGPGDRTEGMTDRISSWRG